MSRPERSLGDRVLASPTVQTLVATTLVFVVSLLVGTSGPLYDYLFVLSPPVLAKPWTVVTSVYAHAGPIHLLTNGLVLALVGFPLERATTSWAFHLYFVATGAVAGLAHVWTYGLLSLATGVLDVLVGWLVAVPTVEAHGVVGASGAVFAILGYHVTGNRLSSTLLDSLSIPGWVQGVAIFVVAGAITLWTAAPNVALVGHFAGLVIGLVAGRVGLLPRADDGDGSVDPRGL